jgi:hypothetical protein
MPEAKNKELGEMSYNLHSAPLIGDFSIFLMNQT